MKLVIQHPDIRLAPNTSLTTNTIVGATSLSVTNSNSFTSTNYNLVGGYNTANSEIKLAGTISTAIAIPIATLSFAHYTGEVVYQIPYNQIEVSYSANLEALWNSGLYASLSDASAAATWVVLSAVTIQVSQSQTIYEDSTAGRSFRYRYKNSTTTTYSDYINIVLPNGYEEKSVGAIFRKAVSITNKKILNTDGSQITSEFLFDEINQCLRWIDSKRTHWNHNQSFNSVLTEITAGNNWYLLPSNIATRESKDSIWNVKIDDSYNLEYIDKRELDSRTIDVHSSFLAAQLTSASVSATFDDTSNVDDSGSFDVWVNGTMMTITYTANNRTTNVLTCPNCATEVTATAAIGTQVWQGASYGVPQYYTIYDGHILFDVVPNSTIHQRNITSDSYLAVQQVNSEDDYVRIENPNVVINWLRKSISLKTNNDTKAAQYDKQMREECKDMIQNNNTGQHQYLKPKTWKYGFPARYGVTRYRES